MALQTCTFSASVPLNSLFSSLSCSRRPLSMRTSSCWLAFKADNSACSSVASGSFWVSPLPCLLCRGWTRGIESVLLFGYILYLKVDYFAYRSVASGPVSPVPATPKCLICKTTSIEWVVSFWLYVRSVNSPFTADTVSLCSSSLESGSLPPTIKVAE